MDKAGIQTAFNDVFDQAIVFHGFADYLRDYDVYIYASADLRTDTAPQHLRYRSKYCVRATAVSAVAPPVWRESLDDRLIDYGQGRDLDGYVWGVKWQNLYPGMSLVTESADADHWSRSLGIPFYEAVIETNGHNLSLVFADLVVDAIGGWHSPFVLPNDEPDFKVPSP